MIAALVLWRSDVWERHVIREELGDEVGGAVSADDYNDILNDRALYTQRQLHASPDIVNAQNELAFRKRELKEAGLDPRYDPAVEHWRERLRRMRTMR